jgi:hypothetical protein
MPLLTHDEFAAGAQIGGTIREDLFDFIENLSPKDTPLFNNLSSVGVNAGYVEYLEDTLPTATFNAWTEGNQATDAALTVPSRNQTIVQNFQRHFHVSGRQQAVNHAGLASMLTYQEMKEMKIMLTEIELQLHQGSAVTGGTNTAPRTAGLLSRLSTNMTASSGTTLTEKVFNDVVTLTYNNPVNLREVYAGMNVKRTINQFSTSVQRYINAGERRQLDLIDVYESESGVMAIFKSRYQLSSSDLSSSGNSWVALDPDFFQLGWLRPIKVEPLGKDGDRDRKFIVGELGMIFRSEKAGAGMTGVVPFVS